MNDEHVGCFAEFVLFLILLMIVSVDLLNPRTYDSELIQRGLKAYDTKTGKLHWTDKAGGDDFKGSETASRTRE